MSGQGRELTVDACFI